MAVLQVGPVRYVTDPEDGLHRLVVGGKPATVALAQVVPVGDGQRVAHTVLQPRDEVYRRRWFLAAVCAPQISTALSSLLC